MTLDDERSAATLSVHPSTSTSTHEAQDSLSLAKILKVLRSRVWLVVGVTLLWGALATTVGLLSKDTYKAEVVLSPVTESGGLGSLGSLASSFGGLASLAGISISGDSRKWESIAVLESASLIESYVRNNDLLKVIYKDKWDATNKRWLIDEPKHIPTLWKGREFFRNRIASIATDNKTGLVTVTVKWTDPNVAATWANGLVSEANNYLRSRALEEAEKHVAYLREQAANTDVIQEKQAIYKVLESEINRSMLARGSPEYAFRVVDAASAPEEPSSLRLWMWTLLGVMAGGFFSILLVVAISQH